ncbi:MAG: hypothetical protein IV097_15395 [Burkholderiaceae bacterium]|nr:hypothetical protein [Burkholderiaceae bacterium]
MDSSFDALIAQGLAASLANQSETALDCFAQAVDCEPASGLPYFLIGAEHAQLGRVQDAEAAFSSAVLLAPEMSIARYQLGLLQFASDRLPMALVTWQPLLTLTESDPLRQFVSGFMEIQRNQPALAIQHFRRGIELNRENPPMNRDVEMVIQQLSALCLVGSAGPDGRPPDASAQMHVLLANYQPNGSPH